MIHWPMPFVCGSEIILRLLEVLLQHREVSVPKQALERDEVGCSASRVQETQKNGAITIPAEGSPLACA